MSSSIIMRAIKPAVGVKLVKPLLVRPRRCALLQRPIHASQREPADHPEIKELSTALLGTAALLVPLLLEAGSALAVEGEVRSLFTSGQSAVPKASMFENT